MSEFAAEHRRAVQRADKMDRKWFSRRPFAVLRLRSSLPFEHPNWGPDNHLREPHVIVSMDKERKEIERRHFRTQNPPKSDQASLLEMWRLHVQLEMQMLSGGSGVATLEQELAMIRARDERAAKNPAINRCASMTGHELLKAGFGVAR